MDEVPAFFLPSATPEMAEEKYAQLAEWCNSSIPNIDRRIYSITYDHDGTEWTATVGKSLRGVRRRLVNNHGVWTERIEGDYHDQAIVWAIFPGYPYKVVTNYRIEKDVISAWENPFFAGQPKSVTYFPLPRE